MLGDEGGRGASLRGNAAANRIATNAVSELKGDVPARLMSPLIENSIAFAELRIDVIGERSAKIKRAPENRG